MNIDSVMDSIMRITAEYESGVFGIYDLKNQASTHLGQKKGKQKTTGNFCNVHAGSGYSIKDAKSFISMVLGGEPENYTASTSLKAAGLDSLSTMEVVNYIHQESGNNELKPSDIDDKSSLWLT